MSDTMTADPTIQAAMGSPGGASGTNEVPDSVGDFISHAANQALLQLPEGVAKGTASGKLVNSILGGLPERMIEAAGGKQKLLESLARPNAAGDITGMVGGALIPTPFGKTKLLGSIARAAGEQGIRSSLSGSETPIRDIVLGGVGGALGHGLGNVAGKVAQKLGGAESKSIKNAAQRTWLANALPNVNNRELKSWIRAGGNTSEGLVSKARSGEITEDLYNALKERALGSKAAQEAFIDAQPERWAIVGKAIRDKGLRLTNQDMIDEIEAGSAVKRYRDFIDNSTDKNVRDELTPAISAADGIRNNPAAPNGVEPGNPRSFYDVRSTLDSRASDAFKAGQSEAAANVGGDLPESKRLLASALKEVDNTYFNRGASLVGDPNVVKDMKADYALAKLLAIGQSKGMTDIGGMRLIQNSLTALRQARTPGAALSTVLAQPIQAGLQALSRPILRTAASGVEKLAGGTGVPGSVVAGMAPFGGRLGGKALGTASETPGVPPEGPPPVGGPPEGMPPPAAEPATAQNAQFTPPAPGKPRPPAPYSISPQARALNIRNGHPDSPMDDAILRGIEVMFNQHYKGQFRDNPQMGKQYHDDYQKAILDKLHSSPGKALDTQLVARVLFPGQGQQQEQFTAAARENLQLTQLLHGDFKNGKPVGNGALDTAGMLGGIPRAFDAQKSVNYNILKQMVEKEGGKTASQEFDKIMTNPLYTNRDDKERAIRRIFQQGDNSTGWRYYLDAIGGAR